jgi:hypothetical protein
MAALVGYGRKESGRVGQGRVGQGRARQGRAIQGRAGRAGQGRAEQKTDGSSLCSLSVAIFTAIKLF